MAFDRHAAVLRDARVRGAQQFLKRIRQRHGVVVHEPHVVHEARLRLVAAHAVAGAQGVQAERLHERLYGERDYCGEAARAAHIARQCHHARGDGGARGETAGHAERAVGAGVVEDDR